MHILHDFIHHFRVEHVEGSFILSKILLLCPTSPSATEVTILIHELKWLSSCMCELLFYDNTNNNCNL